MMVNPAPALSLNIWLEGRVTPKARPRVTRNGTYFPRRYQDWRQSAQAQILAQVSDRSWLPIPRAAVKVQLQGAHRGDLDNLAGAVLDALVFGGILLDDRISCVPRLSVEHQSKGQQGCWVELVSA
jgi:Holliday junction resolvase RusA-like endonuclease